MQVKFEKETFYFWVGHNYSRHVPVS